MSDSPEYQRFLAAMAPPVARETIMAKTHYHVGSNTPGYLPEGDVYTIETEAGAIAALTDDVKRFRDDQYDMPRSQRRTSRDKPKDGRVYFTRPGDSYDLGLVFWWAQCTEDDCEQSDD